MPAGYQRGVTLEANLVYFIQLLRRLGLRISTAETLTALEALKEIPLDREGMVRAALQAALVKDDARVALFHQAWAHFFHPDGNRKPSPGRNYHQLVTAFPKHLNRNRTSFSGAGPWNCRHLPGRFTGS